MKAEESGCKSNSRRHTYFDKERTVHSSHFSKDTDDLYTQKAGLPPRETVLLSFK